jgi:hypothetical protein
MATYNTTTIDNQKLTIQVDKVEERFVKVTYIRVYVEGVKVHQTVLEWEEEDNSIDVQADCKHNVHKCQTCEKEYIVGNHNTLFNCTYCLYESDIKFRKDFEDSLLHDQDPREEL